MSAWIKVSLSLWNHRKMFALMDALAEIDPEITQVAVVGHMVSLWQWAIDSASNGKLPHSSRQIALAARWQCDAAGFVDALWKAGFIDGARDGPWEIHDWEEFAGNLIRKREANAKRMREARKK